MDNFQFYIQCYVYHLQAVKICLWEALSALLLTFYVITVFGLFSLRQFFAKSAIHFGYTYLLVSLLYTTQPLITFTHLRHSNIHKENVFMM